MNKKHYAQPTMKVVELDMADIVCESPNETSVGDIKGNGGFDLMGGSSVNSGDQQRSKGRGIWDED